MFEHNGLHLRFTTAAQAVVTGRRLTGYASVFGDKANLGPFTETIVRGAFAESLRTGADILALKDHDFSTVLARTRSGTLQLAEDDRGLRFEFEAPNTQAANDLLELVRRGDVGGASIGFRFRKNGVQISDDGRHHEVRAVDLHEISIVSAFPAYKATSVAARSQPEIDDDDGRLRLLGIR